MLLPRIRQKAHSKHKIFIDDILRCPRTVLMKRAEDIFNRNTRGLMNKSILLLLLLLIPAVCNAEQNPIVKDGFSYEILEDKRLGIFGEKYLRIYDDIYEDNGTLATDALLLGSLNGEPAIVRYKNFFMDDWSTPVSKYFTLETSPEGTTTIDCIYRKAAYTTDIMYWPYSICNLGKKLTKKRLWYRLPESKTKNFFTDSASYRIKVQECDGISMYICFEEESPELDYMVQYKNKKIILKCREEDGYILGAYNSNKKGLVKIIEKEYQTGHATLEGIEIPELKRKILAEGSLFDINKPEVKTIELKELKDFYFNSPQLPKERMRNYLKN